MAVQFQFNLDKALGVIVYLASKGIPELDKYKLCKLIFLADKHHLVTYGRTITGDTLYALPYGPIPSEALSMIDGLIVGNLTSERVRALSELVKLDRHFANPRIEPIAEYHPGVLSESDKRALDETVQKYRDYDFGQLKSVTHKMFAYRNAWGDRPETAARALMKYEDLFAEESDAITGAFEEMIENDSIRKAFS